VTCNKFWKNGKSEFNFLSGGEIVSFSTSSRVAFGELDVYLQLFLLRQSGGDQKLNKRPSHVIPNLRMHGNTPAHPLNPSWYFVNLEKGRLYLVPMAIHSIYHLKAKW
jgi:hypothetical protein